MHEPAELKDTGGVKSARRALVVIETIGRKGSGLTFSDIQEELGYPKGSLHALLRTLTDSNWVRFDPVGRLFVLGFRAWEIGAAYSRMIPWHPVANEIMGRVRDALGETTQLAVLDNFEALYIAKVDGIHMLKLDSTVGQRLDTHATGVGKVLLSELPAGVLDAWLKHRILKRYTETTIVDHDALRAELERIRGRGYAVDDAERTLGASCIAIPIRNRNGDTVAAMSVSVPTVRFTDEMRLMVIAELRRAAGEMSVMVAEHLPIASDTRSIE